MQKGFVKLNRGFFNNALWKENRTYSRPEAWLDLIASAEIEAGKVHVKGQDIEVQRGELVASNRYLQDRWNWSNTKVSNFLKYLKKNNMIIMRKDSGNTVIKLVKYRLYNDRSDTKNDTEATPKRQSKEIKEREEVFKKQVFKYISKYQKEILNDFFLYWSEKNKNGKKMKFEMQKTFDLERRLSTWINNQKKWKKNGPTKSNTTNQPTINRQSAEVVRKNLEDWDY